MNQSIYSQTVAFRDENPENVRVSGKNVIDDSTEFTVKCAHSLTNVYGNLNS